MRCYRIVTQRERYREPVSFMRNVYGASMRLNLQVHRQVHASTEGASSTMQDDR